MVATRYAQEHERSIAQPEEFWLEAAQGISWVKEPKQALDESTAPLYRWFPDGELNTCFNAVDRHVLNGRGEQTAIIYDSAMQKLRQEITYAELLDQVSRFAGVLRAQGVEKGDRVLIYMPMIPQAYTAMLAVARLGAVHSVVFGGFAPNELAVRIDDCQPKVVVTTSGGLEPKRSIEYIPAVQSAIESSSVKPSTVVVYERAGFEYTIENARAQTNGTAWLSWEQEIQNASAVEPVTVKATDPLYILYTSGTTGTPKGVVRDNGGHAVALHWSMKNIYNLDAGDVMWTASDIGWVVGHSYIVYGPLLAGVTSVMYEGKPVGTPDAGAFWRVAQEAGVKALFTAPTALRAIRKADPEAELLKKYDLDTLETLFVAGERLDPETYHWAHEKLNKPVIDHWWQTETGWAICANLRGLEPMDVKAGSPSVAVPGYNLQVLDPLGEPVGSNEEGNLALKLPLPPGTLPTLWRNDERYRSSYLETFDGYYATGDSGYIDDDGYVYVMGRTDDVINVSGHRLSTGQMEQILASHPAIAECAVIGVADSLKGQRPSGYVVLKTGASIDAETLTRELIAKVRHELGAVADFKEVCIVEALPKTRSGKILRKTMREMADGLDYKIPSTIEDSSVLEGLLATMRSR
ncbi:propionyl-CoA synthetase [Rothia sp. ZJ932]|uniref:propionyl-CoA synthetase n=1 Tax=Rothia sp. ZJ932 TaxID=2810516 RepID=UPI001967DF74|nr:propionyl-CoA synthetase [Rothia sp. ZJ932]QRZ60992.1 propionyl-CoA synthetase [Rothia sp. ZJ932]